MEKTLWNIELQILRRRNGSPGYFQNFKIDVDPEEYVLDAVERVWAFQDRSLTYRHACHHSTCGACGMLVNGVEKLTCITPIRSVTRDGGCIRIEPLRNFPVISDLVVDTGSMFARIEKFESSQVTSLKEAMLPFEKVDSEKEGREVQRLVDCIECGMCISACPISLTDPEYLGPAVLASAQQKGLSNLTGEMIDLLDSRCGLWRCHSAYECSAVCPSNVEPGWRIMNMRQKMIAFRLKNLLFGK